MNLGAMIDLGLDAEILKRELDKLGLAGWRIETHKDSRAGICGTRLKIVLEGGEHCGQTQGLCAHGHDSAAPRHPDAKADKEASPHSHGAELNCHEHHHGHHHECQGHEAKHSHHEHRAYSDIKLIIEKSALNDKVKADALKIFDILARAEAKVHGVPVDEVCFHEVGALDSIIDIAGAAICLDLLGVDRVAYSCAVELGGGRVKCAHGLMPVPAPATALLAENFDSTAGAADHECTTPTGAAIIAALAEKESPGREQRIIACGVGIGERNCEKLPNVLRVRLAETPGLPSSAKGEIERENLCQICANIDDSTPEALSYALDELLRLGALDAWLEGIVMKKSRMATKICALCRPEDAEKMEDAIFLNTPTIGLRRISVSRRALKRSSVGIETKYGTVRVKVCKFNGTEKIKAEFDDCLEIARRNGISVGEAAKEAEYEYRKSRKVKEDLEG